MQYFLALLTGETIVNIFSQNQNEYIGLLGWPGNHRFLAHISDGGAQGTEESPAGHSLLTTGPNHPER